MKSFGAVRCMKISLEIGTTRYADDLLSMKKSLSHMQNLFGITNGYEFGESSSKFGWTFFKITFDSDFISAIETKFSNMIEKYPSNVPLEKFAKFMADYFNSKGSNVKIKTL